MNATTVPVVTTYTNSPPMWSITPGQYHSTPVNKASLITSLYLSHFVQVLSKWQTSFILFCCSPLSNNETIYFFDSEATVQITWQLFSIRWSCNCCTLLYKLCCILCTPVEPHDFSSTSTTAQFWKKITCSILTDSVAPKFLLKWKPDCTLTLQIL